MEPIERSETSASNTQTPGNYPKETVLHLQHGENSNLKSRGNVCLFFTVAHVCPSRSEELVGTKFPLRRNSSISWAALCPNSFPIDIS
jgi:hypothetical protein